MAQESMDDEYITPGGEEAPPLNQEHHEPKAPATALAPVRPQARGPEQGVEVPHLRPQNDEIADFIVPPSQIDETSLETLSLGAPQPIYDVYAAQGMGQNAAPDPVRQNGNQARLGLCLLAVAGGAAAGGYFGGAKGAAAGFLLAGGTLNALRALGAAQHQPQETVISGSFAAVGLAAGGYLAYRTWSPPEMKANPSQESSSLPCDIRPVMRDTTLR
jgi:hypothetical protein